MSRHGPELLQEVGKAEDLAGAAAGVAVEQREDLNGNDITLRNGSAAPETVRLVPLESAIAR